MRKAKTYKDKTYTEWADLLGCSDTLIYSRVKRGWSEEKAVSTPVVGKTESRGLKYDIIGKIYKDRFDNEFLVESFSHKQNHVSYYNVVFLASGYRTKACSSHIRGVGGTHVTDHFYPTYAGVGAIGYGKRSEHPYLYKAWSGMINRCYNPNNHAYKNYGAKGIVVCERWKRFDYFLEDVPYLPGYNKEEVESGKLCLDKDIIDRSKKIYGPETCSFVSRSENSIDANNRRWHGNKV